MRTTIVACPGCAQKLRLPVGLGAIRATCPKCRTTWEWADGKSSDVRGAPAPEVPFSWASLKTGRVPVAVKRMGYSTPLVAMVALMLSRTERAYRESPPAAEPKIHLRSQGELGTAPSHHFTGGMHRDKRPLLSLGGADLDGQTNPDASRTDRPIGSIPTSR